ncbi:cyclin-P3-1 isoform X2 [Cynara cardunculus var. scolymus]|uniref:cyclin-P3-1 isoform X2 n=1 Tax=Cynara cardunculus var. scolymus TaxID=59895 RepID=UPI000D6306C2|nr:cyclin-P3-1 isoform X2 [Cynara cardunculus var. scolymus]
MDDASRTSTPCLDMEGSTLENDILGSKLYISLGLKGQMNQNPGNPKALSFISSLLQKSVEKNETMLQTTQTKDELITVFHGSRAPTLTIQQYVDRIFKYSRCSPSCFIVAYVYIDRFIRSGNIVVTSLNVHRLLITSVMLAAKFIDDEAKFYHLEHLWPSSLSWRRHAKVPHRLKLNKFSLRALLECNNGVPHVLRPILHGFGKSWSFL